MAILFNEKAKTFTLHTRNTSYQMKIGSFDYLLHLYYGPCVPDEDMSYQIMEYNRGFSGNLTNPGMHAPSPWTPSPRNSPPTAREISAFQALR